MPQPTNRGLDLFRRGTVFGTILGKASTLGMDVQVRGRVFETLAGVTVTNLFGSTVTLGSQDALLVATVEEMTPRLDIKAFAGVALGAQDGVMVAVVGEEVN